MSAAIPIAAENPAEELRGSCAGDKLDLRIYANGAGPAKVMMPTKRGLTVPVAMLPDLIRSLKAAELKARELGRTIDGQSQLDGVQFQRLWQDFKRDDPQLVKSLYSEDEQGLIDRFAGVAAKVTRNPANLGLVGMGGSVRQTLGRLPFATLESIPLIGHMADKIDAFAAQRAAMRSTVRAGPRTALPQGATPSFGVQGAALGQLPRRR